MNNPITQPIGVSSRSPFQRAPYLDLVIMRLLVAGFGLACLFFLVHSDLAKAMALPTELYKPLLMTKILLSPIGWGAYPSALVLNSAFYVCIAAGVLALVGWHTNLSMLLFALLMMLLQSFIYSFGELHHREAVLMIAIAVLAFAPCGRYWSIDAARGKGFNSVVDSPSNDPRYSEYAYWPIFVCKAFLALMYLSAVFSKVTYSGFSWANGLTLQGYMAQDGLRWGSDLAVWMSHQHELLLVGQIAVIFFQSTFWLVLFFPRLGFIYYPVGLVFHIMIYVTLKAPFWHWILLYFIFIPYSSIGRALRGEIGFREILDRS